MNPKVRGFKLRRLGWKERERKESEKEGSEKGKRARRKESEKEGREVCAMALGWGQDQDQELEQQIRPPTLTTSGSDLSFSPPLLCYFPTLFPTAATFLLFSQTQLFFPTHTTFQTISLHQKLYNTQHNFKSFLTNKSLTLFRQKIFSQHTSFLLQLTNSYCHEYQVVFKARIFSNKTS